MQQAAPVKATVEGDFWKGVPLAAPSLEVIVSRDADGKRFYIVPPAPGGAAPWRFCTMYDPIAHPETWLSRTPVHIAGYSLDTSHVNRTNARRNEELGLVHDWQELWGKESGKIALIVCAGPSLTESLPALATLARDSDKFFTMGFNRSHRAFDLNYFVSLDRRAQPDWITRDTRGTKLITATTGSPAIAEQFEERYWGETFLDEVDYGFAPLRTGLAITQAEVMLAAYHLGAKEVWLFGSDFALMGAHVQTPRGPLYELVKYYFDTPSALGLGLRKQLVPEQFPVRGIHGRLCFTNYELWAYASYAKTMCMILGAAGVPVRNKSRMGILDWGLDE